VSEENETLEHGHLPDPEGQAIEDLVRRVAELEALVRELAERTSAAGEQRS